MTALGLSVRLWFFSVAHRLLKEGHEIRHTETPYAAEHSLLEQANDDPTPADRIVSVMSACPSPALVAGSPRRIFPTTFQTLAREYGGFWFLPGCSLVRINKGPDAVAFLEGSVLNLHAQTVERLLLESGKSQVTEHLLEPQAVRGMGISVDRDPPSPGCVTNFGNGIASSGKGTFGWSLAPSAIPGRGGHAFFRAGDDWFGGVGFRLRDPGAMV